MDLAQEFLDLFKHLFVSFRNPYNSPAGFLSLCILTTDTAQNVLIVVFLWYWLLWFYHCNNTYLLLRILSHLTEVVKDLFWQALVYEYAWMRSPWAFIIAIFSNQLFIGMITYKCWWGIASWKWHLFSDRAV